MLNNLKKLRNETVIMFGLLFLIFMVLSYFLFYENISIQKKILLNNCSDYSSIYSEYLQSNLAKLKGQASTIAVLKSKANNKEVDDVLKVIYREHNNLLANILILDPKGNVTQTMTGKSHLKNLKDSPCFREAMVGRTVISRKIDGPIVREPVVIVASPIYSNNETIGAIVQSISLKKLHKKLDALQPPNGAYTIIFDDQGKLIYSSKLANDQEKLKYLSKQKFFKEIFLGHKKTVEGYLSLENKKVIYSYAPIPETHWGIVTVQPIHLLDQSIAQIILRNIFILFSLVVLSIIIFYIWRLNSYKEQLDYKIQLEKLSTTSQLAAGVAHEIRNPLCAIKGFIQLMSMKKNQLPSEQTLNLIIEDICRIENTVTEFVNLAKPRQNKFVFCCLNKILEEAKILLDAQATLKEISIFLHLDSELPPIQGCPHQLKQVFINIIKNALEALPQGGLIYISTTAINNREIIVNIKDNGPGIAKDIIDKLGTPFTSTKETGTGLGLMICYEILKIHKAKIEVFSLPNQGTRFQLTFRVK